MSTFSLVLPASVQRQDALIYVFFNKSFPVNFTDYHHFHCSACLCFPQCCLCMLTIGVFRNTGYFDNIRFYCIFDIKLNLLWEEKKVTFIFFWRFFYNATKNLKLLNSKIIHSCHLWKMERCELQDCGWWERED